MIAIIDYGMGNLASVYNAFRKVGENNVMVSSDPAVIRKADKLLLPGVGAFEDAMKNLRANRLVDPILESVDQGKPFLGICLGFQLIFEKSYENGEWQGLGIMKGEVVPFEIDLPVPQIGWNQASFLRNDGVFSSFEGDVYFYFDHGYYPRPADPDIIVAITEYAVEFPSVVMKDNVFATQFHPEKSHRNGLKIIENFANYGN